MKLNKIRATLGKTYMPARNILLSTPPLILLAWYLLERIGYGRLVVKLCVILGALALQLIVVVISSKTRMTRRPIGWWFYNVLTGNGNLPTRLLAFGFLVVVLFAMAFAGVGTLQAGNTSDALIVRFIEVDLSYSFLSFMGNFDPTPLGSGPVRWLGIAEVLCGFMFWGLYISILVNKHLVIQDLDGQNTSPTDLDRLLFDHSAPKKS